MKSAVFSFALLLVVALLLIGCGTGADCGKVIGYTVIPAQRIVDHAANPPLNQASFEATEAHSPNDSCYHATVLIPVPNLTWTTSDSSVATIALAADKTQAIATCLKASATPITITASSGGISGTGTLTCN